MLTVNNTDVYIFLGSLEKNSTSYTRGFFTLMRKSSLLRPTSAMILQLFTCPMGLKRAMIKSSLTSGSRLPTYLKSKEKCVYATKANMMLLINLQFSKHHQSRVTQCRFIAKVGSHNAMDSNNAQAQQLFVLCGSIS